MTAPLFFTAASSELLSTINTETATTGTNITVPAGCNRINVKVWGAGGGRSSPTGDIQGGGGGFESADISVTPGESLTYIVGEGGKEFVGGSPGGGVGNGDGYGGGYSAIKRGSSFLIIAGGGGGSGSADTAYGGAGGGANGQRANTISNLNPSDANAAEGRGGGQVSGGAGGTGVDGNGTAGSYLQGGAGGGNASGGGGGGYYGGGGGGRFGTGRGGGGGGSGYQHPSNKNTVSLTGNYSTPGNAGDPDRDGAGGEEDNGRVIIRFYTF